MRTLPHTLPLPTCTSTRRASSSLPSRAPRALTPPALACATRPDTPLHANPAKALYVAGCASPRRVGVMRQGVSERALQPVPACSATPASGAHPVGARARRRVLCAGEPPGHRHQPDGRAHVPEGGRLQGGLRRVLPHRRAAAQQQLPGAACAARQPERPGARAHRAAAPRDGRRQRRRSAQRPPCKLHARACARTAEPVRHFQVPGHVGCQGFWNLERRCKWGPAAIDFTFCCTGCAYPLPCECVCHKL